MNQRAESAGCASSVTAVAPMTQAADEAEFLRDPIGKWVAVDCVVGWCASPEVCGATLWGHPDIPATSQCLRLFDAFKHPKMGPKTVLVLDAQQLSANIEAFGVVADWLNENRAALKARVRVQVSVVKTGPTGLMLTGILPMLGDMHPFRVFTDALQAYTFAAPDIGAALAAHVAQIVCVVRANHPVLLELEALLQKLEGNLPIGEAARKLGISKRTLQRQLTECGTSFSDVQRECRFRCATELLRATDVKVAQIAYRLGISEGGLYTLIHSRLGVPPAEFRRRGRAGL